MQMFCYCCLLGCFGWSSIQVLAKFDPAELPSLKWARSCYHSFHLCEILKCFSALQLPLPIKAKHYSFQKKMQQWKVEFCELWGWEVLRGKVFIYKLYKKITKNPIQFMGLGIQMSNQIQISIRIKVSNSSLTFPPLKNGPKCFSLMYFGTKSSDEIYFCAGL